MSKASQTSTAARKRPTRSRKNDVPQTLEQTLAENFQPPTIEANFMRIEEELTRNSQYIQQNAGRLPHFQNSDKAEQELRLLHQQIKQLYIQNKKCNNTINNNKSDDDDSSEKLDPAVDKRITKITEIHKKISEEEERIRQLRQQSESEYYKEENEYRALVAKIKETQKVYSKIAKKMDKVNQEAEIARKSLSVAQANLESNHNKIQQLQLEEKRLLLLQKQTRQELKATTNEVNEAHKEESQVTDLERQIAEDTKVLKKISKSYQNKSKIAQEKRQKIEEILSRMVTMENQIEETIETGSNSAIQSQKHSLLDIDLEEEENDNENENDNQSRSNESNIENGSETSYANISNNYIGSSDDIESNERNENSEIDENIENGSQQNYNMKKNSHFNPSNLKRTAIVIPDYSEEEEEKNDDVSFEENLRSIGSRSNNTQMKESGNDLNSDSSSSIPVSKKNNKKINNKKTNNKKTNNRGKNSKSTNLVFDAEEEEEEGVVQNVTQNNSLQMQVNQLKTPLKQQREQKKDTIDIQRIAEAAIEAMNQPITDTKALMARVTSVITKLTR